MRVMNRFVKLVAQDFTRFSKYRIRTSFDNVPGITITDTKKGGVKRAYDSYY